MTEQQIQNKRIAELEEEGYYVIKLTVTNKNGIPDLIAIPQGCDVLFSEIKKEMKLQVGLFGMLFFQINGKRNMKIIKDRKKKQLYSTKGKELN